jgi:hypothetical protein
MQVEVLKLGASMGRSIETASALQSRNEILRDSVAKLADDQRIERLAFKQGMVMPGPAGVGFLHVGSARAVQKAIANIHAPDVNGFLALTTSNGAVTTNPTTTTGTAPAGGMTITPATSAAAPTSATGSTSTGSTSTGSTSTGATTATAATASTSTAPTINAPASLAPTASGATGAAATSTGTSSGG